MNRRWHLPLVVLALLVVAGLIAERVNPLGTTKKRPALEGPISFPRDRPPTRRPPVAKPAAPSLAPVPAELEGGPRPLDRFERAIPAGETVIVAEISAIRHSPLAEALLRCKSADVAEAREQLKTATGIDPLEDVDRLMVGDEGLVVSGYFKDLDLETTVRSEPYGDEAELMYIDGDADGSVLGRIGDDLLVAGPNREAVEATIDRVEGRTSVKLPPALLEGGAELFGPVAGEALREMLNGSPLQPLGAEVDEGTFRATVDDHVAFSLDFDTASETSAEELLQMARGSLSAARVKAAAEGDRQLVELLRNSRLVQRGASLAIDLAVPGDVVLEALECPPMQASNAED